jgi:hypothetical protein
LAISDDDGFPSLSASPHEVASAEDAVAKRIVAGENPARLIGDKADDIDQLDFGLAADDGVKLIATHRGNWQSGSSQNGRVLPSYKRRWKIAMIFALPLRPIEHAEQVDLYMFNAKLSVDGSEIARKLLWDPENSRTATQAWGPW